MSNLLDLIKQLRELAEKATPGVWIKDFSDVIQVGGEAPPVGEEPSLGFDRVITEKSEMVPSPARALLKEWEIK